MPFLDTIKLGFGGNLILGNTTDKVVLNYIAEKHIKEEKLVGSMDLESFGLFDSSQPNYSTYYPDVTAEDLAPKESEFIQPIFRALSEVIVHKEWNPVDFSMNGVLKKSMPLLKGQSVNADHETALGNAMGAVKDVMWEESYKTPTGITIPAGINSRLKLDGKSNPRIARGIMMDPPSIHSTSVTVQFIWEKSHPELADQDFWSKLGSFDKDAKLIRRITTSVKKYNEISLVGHGADPYAQLVKENGIVNPNYADISYNSVEGKHKAKQNFFFYDFKSDVIKNSIPKESNNNNSHQTETMNKTFLLALAAVFGKTIVNPDAPTDAELTEIQNAATAALNANTTNQTLLTQRQTEIDRLKLIETQYTAEKVTLGEVVPLKAFKDNATNTLRAAVNANYLVLAKNTPEKAMTELIAGASFETLTALNNTYSQQLEEKFPLSCKKCGGTEVNRASSVQPNQQENAAGDTTEPVGLEAYLISKQSQNGAVQMHGDIKPVKK